MSTPENKMDFSWARPTPIESQDQNSAMDFSWANPNTPQRTHPFRSYLSELSKGIVAGYYMTTPGADLNNAPEPIKSKAISMIEAHAAFKGGGIKKALEDFTDFHGLYNNVVGQIKGVADSPKELFEAARTNPAALAGQLGLAFVQPLGDLFESTLGINFTSGPGARPLTPEERADKIKNVAAFSASLAAGAGVRGLVGTAKAAKIIQGSKDVAKILKAERALSKSTLANQILTGGLEASAAGATYGAIRFAGEDDQLKEIISNGIVFAPLGIAFETLGYRGAANKRLGLRVAALAKAQELQFDPNIHSAFQGVATVEALMGADNLVNAVIDANIKSGNQFLIEVPGVTAEEYKGVLEKWVPERYSIAVHTRPDGLKNVLLHSPEMSIDPSFYGKTGHIKGSVVDIDGKAHIVSDVNKEGLVVRSPSGKYMTVDPASVRKNLDITGPSIEFQFDVGYRTLINQESAATGKPLTDIVRTTQKGEWGKVQSGKPTIITAFRNRNIEDAARTGKHYQMLPSVENTANVEVWEKPTNKVFISKNTKPGEKPWRVTFIFDIAGQETPTGHAMYDTYAEAIKDVEKHNYTKTESKGANVLMEDPYTLAFENPLVIEGRRGELYRKLNDFLEATPQDIHDKDVATLRNAWIDLTSHPDNPISISNFDRIAHGLVNELMGKDGIIYRAIDENLVEAIDLAGHPRAKIEPIKTKALSVSDVTRESFLNSLYNDWKDNIEHVPMQFTPEDISKINVDPLYTTAIQDGLPVIRIKDLENLDDIELGALEQHFAKNMDEIINKQLWRANRLARKAVRDELVSRGSVQIDPGFNFEQHLAEWADSKNIKPDQRETLTRMFADKLEKEAFDALPKEDQTVISKLREEAAIQNQKFADTHIDSYKDLIRKANSNGMYLTFEDASNIVVRNIKDETELGRFNKYDDANKFINESGQAKGPNLDGDSGGPPGIGRDFISPSGGPPEDGAMSGKPGFIENIRDTIGKITPWITDNRNWIIAVDNKLKNVTQFFNKVFVPLQDARRLANAKMWPYLVQLRDKIEKVVVGMSRADRETVGDYIQTLSPDEVIARFDSGRKLTDIEVALGRRIADPELDIDKAFALRRYIKNLQEDVKNKKLDVNAMQDAIDQARAAYNIKKGSKTDQAVELFDEITLNNPNVMKLGNITRLARSIKNNEMTRAEFAAHHEMTPAQLKAADRIDAMYKELSAVFGINPKHQLGGYMTHARLYYDGDMSTALRDFGVSPSKDAYFKMVRTGEISAYERDPIIAMQRYIKAGFDSMHFTEKYNQALRDFREELRKIQHPATQEVVRHRIARYIEDVRGIPNADVKFTQQAINELTSDLGININIDVRKNIVNVISGTGESAAQGLRVAAGLRDLAFGIGSYWSEYGAIRTARMLIYGAKGLEKLNAKSLLEMGEISQSSPVVMGDPVEVNISAVRAASGRAIKTLQKFNDVAFKLSGQKDVYTLLHAGIYLDQFKQIGDALAKYRKGDIPLSRVYKDVSLSIHERPVVEEFKRLVEDGQDENATRYLAKQAGYEHVAVYGLGNNPNGWTTNIGRLVGQFGRWPVWYKSYLGRLLSRGSMATRATHLLRHAAFWYALDKTSQAVGFDIRNWIPYDALTFGGGPVVSAFADVMKAMFGHGYYQQEAQQRLKRYLPYDPWSGKFNIGQIYIPGSYFGKDLAEAFDLAKRGFNPIDIMGRALGVKVYDSERSWLDNFLGNRPRITNGRNPKQGLGILDPERLITRR